MQKKYYDDISCIEDFFSTFYKKHYIKNSIDLDIYHLLQSLIENNYLIYDSNGYKVSGYRDSHIQLTYNYYKYRILSNAIENYIEINEPKLKLFEEEKLQSENDKKEKELQEFAEYQRLKIKYENMIPKYHYTEITNHFIEDGMTFIDAYSTYENDEEAFTIAKVDNETKEVIYIDERAKTDTLAQKVIFNTLFYIDLAK
jgi:hypothetical protein